MRPQLWVFAGPSGAGKSTLVDHHVGNRIPVVNPDTIARNLPSGLHDAERVIRAGRMAVAARSALLDERRTFAIETTLTGQSELHVMRAAAANAVARFAAALHHRFRGLGMVALSSEAAVKWVDREGGLSDRSRQSQTLRPPSPSPDGRRTSRATVRSTGCRDIRPAFRGSAARSSGSLRSTIR